MEIYDKDHNDALNMEEFSTMVKALVMKKCVRHRDALLEICFTPF